MLSGSCRSTLALAGGSIAICVLLVGCETTKVSAVAMKPAGSEDASRMRRVAVLPFEAPRGVDVTGDVETLIASVVVEDKRYFDVVERQRLQTLVAEMKLAYQDGAVDPKTASRLGKMLGAQGIYTGRVVRSQSTDERFTEPRQVCTQYEQKRDKKGNAYDGACQRWQTQQAQCTVRSAIFEFAPKLVSVETATIVYARNHSGEAKSKSCVDPGGQVSQPLTDGTRLLADARRTALDSFRLDLAPSMHTRTVELLDSTDAISAQQAKERFKGGVAFARGNRLDRACEIWQEVIATETRSPELAHNLGVCAETSGNLERALALYTTADRLLSAPNKTISAALQRVRQDQQDRAKAQKQLR